MLHLSHLLLHVVHLLLELPVASVLVLGRLSVDAGTSLFKLQLLLLRLLLQLLLQLLLAAQMERRLAAQGCATGAHTIVRGCPDYAASSMPLGPAGRVPLHYQPMELAIGCLSPQKATDI